MPFGTVTYFGFGRPSHKGRTPVAQAALERRKKVFLASWATRVRAPLASLAPPYSDKPKPKPIPTDISCDECGETMVIRTGRSGQFLGCSKYPKCKGTKPLQDGASTDTLTMVGL